MPVSKAEFIEKGRPYFPAEALDFAFFYFDKYDFNLKITRPRLQKKGDFSYFYDHSRRPVITVNQDLCSYEFLLVYIHELAHLFVYLKYPRQARPHGEKWKEEYRMLIYNALENIDLPSDIREAWLQHTTHIKSSGDLDETLEKCFVRYRPHIEGSCTIKELQVNDFFTFRNQRYQLLAFARTRATCLQTDSGRKYTIPMMAQVTKENPA